MVLKEDDSIRDSLESLDISMYKNGIMWIRDPITHEWIPHYFVLTANKLCFMEKPPDNENSQLDEENEENDVPETERRGSEDLHLAENWFHGRLERGRDRAVELLLQNSMLGDGTFLVRESTTFVGDYSLSFL